MDLGVIDGLDHDYAKWGRPLASGGALRRDPVTNGRSICSLIAQHQIPT
jgi:hypothetical protein